MFKDGPENISRVDRSSDTWYKKTFELLNKPPNPSNQ